MPRVDVMLQFRDCIRQGFNVHGVLHLGLEGDPMIDVALGLTVTQPRPDLQCFVEVLQIPGPGFAGCPGLEAQQLCLFPTSLCVCVCG